MSKPSLASRTAVALPMPESEPVIIAVFAMPPAYPAAAPPCRRAGSRGSQRAKRREDPNPNASRRTSQVSYVHHAVIELNAFTPLVASQLNALLGHPDFGRRSPLPRRVHDYRHA